MNVRIQELATQAKESVPKGILGVDHWIDSYNNIFSKLLIEECIQIMREQETLPPGFLYSKRVDIHEHAIKKHFGIE